MDIYKKKYLKYKNKYLALKRQIGGGTILNNISCADSLEADKIDCNIYDTIPATDIGFGENRIWSPVDKYITCDKSAKLEEKKKYNFYSGETPHKLQINKKININNINDDKLYVCEDKKRRVILVIGAGPVGLYVATRLSQDKNNLVYILEKRAENTRKQILYLGKITVSMLKSIVPETEFNFMTYCTIGDPLFQNGRCKKKTPTKDFDLQKITDPKNNKDFYEIDKHDGLSISINHLIDILRTNIIKEQNVVFIQSMPKFDRIEYNYNNNRSEVVIPTIDKTVTLAPDIIIGCDGTHSRTEDIFKLNPLFDYDNIPPVGYGFTYTFPSDAKKDINSYWAKIPQNRYRYFEGVKGHDDYITCQLYTDEYKEYSSLSSDEDKEHYLRNILFIMFKYYDIEIKDGVELPEVNINLFPIKLFAKDKIYKRIPESQMDVYLAGDSAFGGHYFSGSGINYGYRMGWKLCDVIGNNDNPSEYQDFVEYFENINYDNHTLSWNAFSNSFGVGRYADKEINIQNAEIFFSTQGFKFRKEVADLWIENMKKGNKGYIKTYVFGNNDKEFRYFCASFAGTIHKKYKILQ